MTVEDLIEILSTLDPQAEVRIMSQRSWPFENALEGVAPGEDTWDEDEAPQGVEKDGVVYLVQGEQIGYGTQAAWSALIS